MKESTTTRQSNGFLLRVNRRVGQRIPSFQSGDLSCPRLFRIVGQSTVCSCSHAVDRRATFFRLAKIEAIQALFAYRLSLSTGTIPLPALALRRNRPARQGQPQRRTAADPDDKGGLDVMGHVITYITPTRPALLMDCPRCAWARWRVTVVA
jgi:hypothetical protein